MELAALMIAVMTLPNNFISVFILSRYGDGQFQNWRSAMVKIVINPNILGCVIGLALYAAGIALPKVLDDSLKLLGQTALPMALLSIGAGLRWHVGQNYAGMVALTNGIKLILLPLLVWVFCGWIGVGDLESKIAVLYTALPSATTSYVMSRQMGGHPELMAGILSSQCLLAMVTIPLMLLILFHGV
jgi:predicted permease